MKKLNTYLTEKLKIGKTTKPNYVCQPKSKAELRKILEERLAKDKNANLNDIDVSEIIDMGEDNNMMGLFEFLDPHNIDISQWDVSNVETMNRMFFNCKNFNCDLSNWDVSNVKDMANMFYACENFNCDLCDWKVSKVKDMAWMFKWCNNFNCDLGSWDVSNVENMRNMFYGCYKLKNTPNWYKE